MPSAARLSFTAAATVPASDTSTLKVALAPVSAAALSSAGASISHSTASPPSATMRAATALPRPDAPPVTMALRPLKRSLYTVMAEAISI